MGNEYAVTFWYRENPFKKDEFNAWDWYEEDSWEDEWGIWCRAQGIFLTISVSFIPLAFIVLNA